MSEETQEATPLVQGQEYVALLRITTIGGGDTLKIELEKSPESFMEGDPNELLEMPLSFAIMDEIVRGLMETGGEQVKPRPHLTVVH